MPTNIFWIQHCPSLQRRDEWRCGTTLALWWRTWTVECLSCSVGSDEWPLNFLCLCCRISRVFGHLSHGTCCSVTLSPSKKQAATVVKICDGRSWWCQQVCFFFLLFSNWLCNVRVFRFSDPQFRCLALRYQVERLFGHSCSECYLVGRTDIDFVCGAIVAKPFGKFRAAMGLRVSSSQHTSLLSHFDECHGRRTCCFTANSWFVAGMYETTVIQEWKK